MGKKTLPNMLELEQQLDTLRETFFEICNGVVAFTKDAGELDSERAETLQRSLVMVARDATDAAVRLNTTIRTARNRETLERGGFVK
jgi:hypothetical protein